MFVRFLLLWAVASLALIAHAQTPATSAPTADAAIALIVPGPSTPFARAGEALREGFIAAHRATRAPVAIQVLEIEAGAAPALEALQSARDRGVRAIVGPLTRAAVNGVVDRGDAGVPVLLLNVPDNVAAIADSQLAFGLSVEDEAALLVRTALREIAPGVTPTAARRHVVVVGAGGLARRIAAAFVAALREAGAATVTLDYEQYGADGIAREINKAPAASIFLALDAAEAVQVRTRLPIDAPLYATSQINTGSGGLLLANDLEGLRFVDMPWLLDPERPGAKAFPRSVDVYSAELQRLYAFGIDAYRVALEWMERRQRFEIDGVTGWLRVDRARSARVERTPMFAVFRGGRAERSEAPLREIAR